MGEHRKNRLEGEQQQVFNGFSSYWPLVAEMTLRWWDGPFNVIFAELSDGTTVRYDHWSNGLRTLREYDGTEERWKREFSNRLIDMMVDEGFDEIYLAEKSGVSQQSISNYIRAKTIPTGYVVAKLAKALGCKSADLIGFD